MSDALKIFTDLPGQVGRLPLAGILAIVILITGLALKRLRLFPNRFIPVITLVLGGVGFAILGDPKAVTSVTAGWRQYVILSFYGTIESFLVWGAHRYILKKFEKFLPEGFFPADEFDTQPPFPANNAGDAQPKPTETKDK